MNNAILLLKKASFYKNIIIFYMLLMAYNCHRYIFMYNSTKTSPTYHDTPLVWKVGKYIVIPLSLMAVYLCQRPYKNSKVSATIIIFSFIFWIFLVNYIWMLTFSEFLPDEWEYVIWSVALIPVLFFNDESKCLIANFIPDNFTAVSAFVILSDFYVIANYYVTGRLTALSYENSLLRFGGLWDDPNGFGLFCSYLAYIALKKRKWLIFALLSVCIYYTVSFSSYFLLLVVIVLWGLKGFRLKADFVKLVSLVCASVMVLAFTFWDKIVNYATLTFQRKSGSMEEHAKVDMDFTLFPYLQRKFIFHETWYISFFYNYAPFSILFLILLLVFAGSLLTKKYKKISDVFLLLFLLDCMFLPMFAVFPLNVCFFVMLYASLGIQKKEVYTCLLC